MPQKLLLCLCLFVAVHTLAQERLADYRQPGSPMPRLVILPFHDSTAQKGAHKKALSRRKRKQQAKEMISRNPQQLLNADDIRCKGNLLVMIFNPNCSHCDDITTMLEQNAGLFKKSKIILLANNKMAYYVPDFLSRHHIDNYPCMYLGADSSGFIDNTFLYQPLPQINIYNRDRKLIKTYAGETPIDTLKKFIQ